MMTEATKTHGRASPAGRLAGLRRKLAVNTRKSTAFGFYGIKKIASSLREGNRRPVTLILFYPTVRDTHRLADLVNRISWYLPPLENSKVNVLLPVDEALLDIHHVRLEVPASQQSYIGKDRNVQLVPPGRAKLAEPDLILLWRKNSIMNPCLWRYFGKADMVDPWFYSAVESKVYQRLKSQTVGTQRNAAEDELLQLSKRNFGMLTEAVAGSLRGYVFGTGPSLEQAYDFDFTGGFRIACNSIVKNKQMLHHIRPQLLAFLDPVFHFSPCLYAAEFRRRMLEVVEEFGCYVMVPDYAVGLLLDHYPQLRARIIGMPIPGILQMSLRESIRMLGRWRTDTAAPNVIPGHKESYNFPSSDRFYVRGTPSVMTTVMVPVASTLCEEIFIIGADGRKPSESYFWTHSSASQFEDLLQTVFDTHPSFFRDADYQSRYHVYCQGFEELLSYGESKGKRYYALTPSYTPALARRLASPEELKGLKVR